MKMEDYMNRLKELRQLSDNWNGYGSPVISKSTIDKARLLIYQLADLNLDISIFPTADGYIQIEWFMIDVYYEITIDSLTYQTYIEYTDKTWLEQDFIHRSEVIAYIKGKLKL